MRNILHDHPDSKCELILRNLKSAMGPDSMVVIDEMCLPAKETTWRAAQLDLTMMTALAGRERTQKQFEAILDAAGLELVQVLQYTEELHDVALVAKVKQLN